MIGTRDPHLVFAYSQKTLINLRYLRALRPPSLQIPLGTNANPSRLSVMSVYKNLTFYVSD